MLGESHHDLDRIWLPDLLLVTELAPSTDERLLNRELVDAESDKTIQNETSGDFRARPRGATALSRPGPRDGAPGHYGRVRKWTQKYEKLIRESATERPEILANSPELLAESTKLQRFKVGQLGI